MLNHRYTSGEQSRKHNINNNYHRIYDEKHKLICGVNKSSICNLHGDIIANFKETIKDEDGNSFRVYQSLNHGTFEFDGEKIYNNGEYVGKRELNRMVVYVLAFIAITGMLLLLFTLLRIKTPVEFTQFNINIVDKEGNIALIDKPEILPQKIYPGKKGSYEFTLENKSDYTVWYSISLYEYYNETNIKSFPMEYKLKINNEYADFTSTDKELIKLTLENGKIDSKTQQKLVIEWEWPFDSGNDIYDTNLGYENGKYMILLKIETGINR